MIYLFTTLFLVVILVLFMFVTTNERKNYVKSTECNKPLGEYSVESGLDSKSFTDTFKSITTLTDAINKCNLLDNCDRFSYNETLKVMKTLSMGSDTFDNESSNIYTRQVGVTYKK